MPIENTLPCSRGMTTWGNVYAASTVTAVPEALTMDVMHM